jgi:NTP pyrophosphatase (non-canonical NTP hydrolase)
MQIREFQKLIDRMYSEKDRRRGSAGTFIWLIEEIGELASALGDADKNQKAEEFADVFAWLATLANVEGIDLDDAVEQKYGKGCPGCAQMICTCKEKP